METFKKWVNSPVGIATALAISGIAAFILIGLGFGLNKSEWAYWVQAIGSIGAIIGTWYGTKTQLLHANNARIIQRLEDEAGNAHIAFDLATDAHRALTNIEGKLIGAQKSSRRFNSGVERLQALSLSLHNFAARPIPPVLYVEILCLQREVSFTITAVTQENANMSAVKADRIYKAGKRSSTVLACKQRIEAVLKSARKTAGISAPVFERQSNLDEDDS